MLISDSVKKYSPTIFWNLCKYLTLVDTINGFCIIKNIPLPIGQAYKLVLLLFLCVNMIKFPKGRIILTLYLLYILIYINHLFINTASPYILDTVIQFSKFLIVPLMLSYLLELNKVSDSIWYWKNIVKVLKYNVIFLCVNVFSGLIGIGTHTYDDSIGYKGFLYAVNEISGVGIVLFCFFIYYTSIIYKYNKRMFIITNSILVGTAVLLGTKTLLICTLFALYYLPSITLINSKKRKKKVYKILILIVSLCILLYGGYILLDNIGFLDRWSYFYNKGGLEQIIFSGRNVYWLEEQRVFYDATPIVQLLGLGENRTVEMDPFDVLLNFGYIGFFVIYSFYLCILLRSFKKRNKNNIAKLIFFVNLLLLTASCFAGHVIFSGMLGPLVAILNSMINLSDKTIYTNVFISQRYIDKSHS